MLVLTRPGIDVSLPRGVLIPLQLLAVLALADLSYRFVELPFRGKAKLPALPDGWLRVGRPALLVAVLAIVVAGRLERHRRRPATSTSSPASPRPRPPNSPR